MEKEVGNKWGENSVFIIPVTALERPNTKNEDDYDDKKEELMMNGAKLSLLQPEPRTNNVGHWLNYDWWGSITWRKRASVISVLRFLQLKFTVRVQFSSICCKNVEGFLEIW
jgi:hypothetical protein